jgi:hypothetical protein
MVVTLSLERQSLQSPETDQPDVYRNFIRAIRIIREPANDSFGQHRFGRLPIHNDLSVRGSMQEHPFRWQPKELGKRQSS